MLLLSCGTLIRKKIYKIKIQEIVDCTLINSNSIDKFDLIIGLLFLRNIMRNKRKKKQQTFVAFSSARSLGNDTVMFVEWLNRFSKY